VKGPTEAPGSHLFINSLNITTNQSLELVFQKMPFII
jgi:hypothetical protein